MLPFGPWLLTQCRARPKDEVYDFNKWKHTLPKASQPKAGYCWSSMLLVRNLVDIVLRCIWDGGAEGTSISPAALSRVLRAQEKAGLSAQDCPFNGMALMNPPQRFFSFAQGSEDKGTEVDIMGYLTLATADGEEFPPMLVRMVPGQVDDLLVAAPDLDALGFDRHSNAEQFVFRTCGFSVPRETPSINVRQTLVNACASSDVRLRESCILRPHEALVVPCTAGDVPVLPAGSPSVA